MKVHMQFIDRKGFIHFASCTDKRKAVKNLKTLKAGTEIHWTSPNQVTVSQQYLRK